MSGRLLATALLYVITLNHPRVAFGQDRSQCGLGSIERTHEWSTSRDCNSCFGDSTAIGVRLPSTDSDISGKVTVGSGAPRTTCTVLFRELLKC